MFVGYSLAEIFQPDNLRFSALRRTLVSESLCPSNTVPTIAPQVSRVMTAILTLSPSLYVPLTLG